MGIGHAGSTDGWLAAQSRAGIYLLGVDSSSFLFSQANRSKNPHTVGGGAADPAAGDRIWLMEQQPFSVVEQCGGKNSLDNHVTRYRLSAFFFGKKNEADLSVSLIYQSGLHLEFFALSFGPQYHTSSLSTGKNITHSRR